jgi:hypothetical protein
VQQAGQYRGGFPDLAESAADGEDSAPEGGTAPDGGDESSAPSAAA